MILNKSLSQLVSIGISTKNRWADLEITLQKLAKSDLKDIPVLILDDASEKLCPFEVCQYLPNITLQRFEQSEGYIKRRNQIAQSIETKYYLSLDDDSYPVSGCLKAAVEFAETHNNGLLCLSFPIYNPVAQKHQNITLMNIPYQVRSFIGCGHLLHREHFLGLGGYIEELVHQGEEMDIAARGFQEGFLCYHFPGLKIHHTASNVGRNWHRMDYYGVRNNILWNDWFMPPYLRGSKQLRSLAGRSMLTLKTLRSGRFQGELAGFKAIHNYKNKRNPMTKKLYRAWRGLPHC